MIRIVLADVDELYIRSLKRKFLTEIGSQAEVVVITSREYLADFFSKPQSLDLLVIHETLYADSLKLHNIGHIFLLSEQKNADSAADSPPRVYKYTSVGDIFGRTCSKKVLTNIDVAERLFHTRVITLFSPIGGCGKTTLAVGIAAALCKMEQCALYINLECRQNFGYLFSDETCAPPALEYAVAKKDTGAARSAYEAIRRDATDYCPAFRANLVTLGIQIEQMQHFVMSIIDASEYDYIVLEIPNELNAELLRMFALSYRILIVTAQDGISGKKTKSLLNSMDLSDTKRIGFLCNRFHENEANELLEQRILPPWRIWQYVPFIPSIAQYRAEGLAGVDAITQIAASVMR